MSVLGKYLFFLICFLVIAACEKENDIENPIISDYTGSYRNVEFTEILVGDFTPGVYRQDDIPKALKQMSYGRLEIDFTYMGGALTSFMPILYYGSINKNESDNTVEETQFHLVVEIGHYNVIPFPVENLFYTICYDRYPLYCRDTYIPVISGEDYTYIIDKKPEGIILQLRKGEEIVNSMPSAFFPDSSQLFFTDVTRWIDHHRGDSLETILMVAQGFVGFDKGLRIFNGHVPSIRIYRYELSQQETGYELYGVKNQHYVRQKVNYAVKDYHSEDGNSIRMKYYFQPYSFKGGTMKPNGDIQSSVINTLKHDQQLTYNINANNVGLYKIYLETININDQVIQSTGSPFIIWVYPEPWAFDY